MFSNDVDFIQQLARLIYCAGSVDGDFSRDEKKQSLEIIIDLSANHLGMSSDELMINEIADLVDNQSNPDTLINEFKNYYETNPDKFDEDVKKSILDLLDSVIYAHAKRNKSELVFLSQLELLFFGRLFR